MNSSGTRVALADTRLVRPVHLNGAVEITTADLAPRSFPAHLSGTVGICVKVGPEHAVVADGRRLLYPEDAVCVRPAGCVWESAAGTHGFVSIDLQPGLAPGLHGPMRFAEPGSLPSIRRSAAALDAADSAFEAEELVARLLVTVLDAGLLQTAYEDDDGQRVVDTARAFLADQLHARPTLGETARAAGVDQFSLLRRFRQRLHTTPHAYLIMLRLARAQSQLAAGSPPSEVAVDCGFADQAHLGRWFRRVHGVTPGQYARPFRIAIPL